MAPEGYASGQGCLHPEPYRLIGTPFFHQKSLCATLTLLAPHRGGVLACGTSQVLWFVVLLLRGEGVVEHHRRLPSSRSVGTAAANKNDTIYDDDADEGGAGSSSPVPALRMRRHTSRSWVPRTSPSIHPHTAAAAAFEAASPCRTPVPSRAQTVPLQARDFGSIGNVQPPRDTKAVATAARARSSSDNNSSDNCCIVQCFHRGCLLLAGHRQPTARRWSRARGGRGICSTKRCHHLVAGS